jgi:hypothetical protein
MHVPTTNNPLVFHAALLQTWDPPSEMHGVSHRFQLAMVSSSASSFKRFFSQKFVDGSFKTSMQHVVLVHLKRERWNLPSKAMESSIGFRWIIQNSYTIMNF